MSHPDCDRIAHSLSEGEALPASLHEHCERCPYCKNLRAFDSDVVHAMQTGHDAPLEMSPALREALANTKPVETYSPSKRMMPSMIALGVIVCAGLFVMRRDDFTEQSSMRFWMVGALWAALAVGALALLFRRSRGGLGAPARTHVVWVVGTVLVFSLVSWTTSRVMPSSLDAHQQIAVHEHALCSLWGSLVSLLLLSVVLRFARASAANAPVTAGAIAGLGAGMCTVLFQHLECPVAAAAHVGVAHLVPIVVATAAGALLGRRMLAP